MVGVLRFSPRRVGVCGVHMLGADMVSFSASTSGRLFNPVAACCRSFIMPFWHSAVHLHGRKFGIAKVFD